MSTMTTESSLEHLDFDPEPPACASKGCNHEAVALVKFAHHPHDSDRFFEACQSHLDRLKVNSTVCHHCAVHLSVTAVVPL